VREIFTCAVNGLQKPDNSGLKSYEGRINQQLIASVK